MFKKTLPIHVALNARERTSYNSLKKEQGMVAARLELEARSRDSSTQAWESEADDDSRGVLCFQLEYERHEVHARCL